MGKDPAQGVFEKSAFLHPDLSFRMDLPEGWKTLNTPSALGAVEAKGKGMIIVGMVEGPLDPEKAAQKTIAIIEKNARKKPADARSVQVNGHPGYYALYAEKKSNLHLLWVVLGGKLFRMAGVGEDQFKQALRDSALSLRPLPAADRASIRVLRLRLASPARASLSTPSANAPATRSSPNSPPS